MALPSPAVLAARASLTRMGLLCAEGLAALAAGDGVTVGARFIESRALMDAWERAEGAGAVVGWLIARGRRPRTIRPRGA